MGNWVAGLLLTAVVVSVGWFLVDTMLLVEKGNAICAEYPELSNCQTEVDEPGSLEISPLIQAYHTTLPNGREVYCVALSQGNTFREPVLTCDWSNIYE